MAGEKLERTAPKPTCSPSYLAKSGHTSGARFVQTCQQCHRSVGQKGHRAERGQPGHSPHSEPQPRSLLCAKACLNKRAHTVMIVSIHQAAHEVSKNQAGFIPTSICLQQFPLGTVQFWGGPWKESHVAHAGMDWAEQPGLGRSRATESVNPPHSVVLWL